MEQLFGRIENEFSYSKGAVYQISVKEAENGHNCIVEPVLLFCNVDEYIL